MPGGGGGGGLEGGFPLFTCPPSRTGGKVIIMRVIDYSPDWVVNLPCINY